jgi:DNA-binding NarL/FixJ family response regulator
MKNVLVLEDQASSLGLIRSILEPANYRVTPCPTAIDALVSLSAVKFDLIIADISLPDINGIEFLRRAAREQKFLPPCIGVSACDDASVVSDALNTGMIRVFKKPVNPNELVETCDAAVNRHREPAIAGSSTLNISVLDGLRSAMGADVVSEFVEGSLIDLQRCVSRLARMAVRGVGSNRWFYFSDALRGVAMSLGAEALATVAADVSGLPAERVSIAGADLVEQLLQLIDELEIDLKRIPYLTISSRERAVIQLAASGMNNAAIAAALDIKRRTVVFHLQRIARKLNTTGRVHTIAQALKQRVI